MPVLSESIRLGLARRYVEKQACLAGMRVWAGPWINQGASVK